MELRTLYKMFGISKSIRRYSATDQRYSTTDQILSTERNSSDITDPISLITHLFKEGDAVELSRALQWMEVMIRSG